MSWKHANLYLAIFWLCVGTVILFREALFPGRFRADDRVDWLSYLAWALAGWNLANWWMRRSYAASQEALARERAAREERHRRGEEKPVTNPEFAFDEPPPEAPLPPASPNGERR